MIRIELKGLKVARTGTFASKEVVAALDNLESYGAHLVKISRKMQLLVCGANGFSKQPNKAHKKGIPIIGEEDLLTLLRQGYLDFKAEGAIERVVDTRREQAVFGEVRSILNMPYAHRHWGHLCVLLAQCEGEALDALVCYVEHEVSRWTVDQQLSCDLPKAWMLQMLKGDRSPMFGLVRCIDLGMGESMGRELAGKEAAKLLQHPDLEHVMSVKFPGWYGWPGGRDVFYALDDVSWRERLIEVDIGMVSSSELDVLMSRMTFDGVRRVRMDSLKTGMSDKIARQCFSIKALFFRQPIERLVAHAELMETVGYVKWVEEHGEEVYSEDMFLNSLWGHRFDYFREWVREILANVNMLDLSEVKCWSDFTQDGFADVQVKELSVLWPDVMLEPESRQTYFDCVLSQNIELDWAQFRLPVGVRLLECVVNQEKAAELVTVRGKELLGQLTQGADELEQVVVRGNYDERVEGWFGDVFGERVVFY